MKQIELTEAEVSALLQLMDAGVKTLGLNVVEAAAGLIVKIKAGKEVAAES